MADVSTTRVVVIFRVIGSGLCNPEKDCCWLWLTFRQPVWKSSSESLGRVCVILVRTSSCSVIVRVSVVLKRTVGDSD